jgi:riboflavin kinase/FMN adenylyltransferase
MAARSVISIGNFDGVHVGHAALLRHARSLADAGGVAGGVRVVALAFDPHPMTILKPAAAPAALMGFSRRAELLRSLGADEVIRLEATPEFLARSAEEFIAAKVEQYRPIAFVEGDDFHFGKGRAGNNRVLAGLGLRFGFEVHVVPPVEVVLSDHTVARASSSLARWLIGHGRARDAAQVLGRSHELHGVVRQGDRRGRTIGFPTANLETADLLPADGVYACVAVLPGGERLAAALNVGTRPTFAGVERRVEAHVIGAAREGESAAIRGLAEYGWALRLEVHAWVRDQVRFASIDALTEQLHRDCGRVEAILRDPPMAAGFVRVEGPRGEIAACR